MDRYQILDHSICFIFNRNADEDKTEIEIQRMNLEKEKEQFEKEQEAFGKRQEAFEKRRRTLEEAQARLEAEKILVQKEHAEQVLYCFLTHMYTEFMNIFYQTKQLHEDWQNLTALQRQRELELEEKEKELIYRREKLEKERFKIMSEVT